MDCHASPVVAPLQELLGRLGVELAVIEAGRDTGLLPLNSFAIELADLCTAHSAEPPLHAAAAALRGWMDRILDTTGIFDEPTIDRLIAWHTWMEQAITALQSGSTVAPFSDEIAGLVEKPAPTAPPAPSPETAAAPGQPITEPVLILNIESDGDLLAEFLNESQEHLQNIEQGVLVLEENPSDADTLNSIFRAFHTFKGGSGFLNLVAIKDLAHELESLLDAARQGKLTIDSPVIDVILEGGDTLKQFVAAMSAQLAGQNPGGPILVPTLDLIRRVQAILTDPEAPRAARPAPADPEPLEPAPVTALANLVLDAAPEPPAEPPKPLEIARAASPAPSAATNSGSVKVDTRKLDSLIDLVGELVISQTMVIQDPSVSTLQSQTLTRNLAQLRRITNELQRTTMSLRMVPIRATFQKMTRLVRDLAARQGKQMQLVLSGEDTELDRNIVEELADPLVHMIRNAADHGVEQPEARTAKGKPPGGTIHLRAFHKGGNIVIQIQDDGNGLSKDRLLAKARERGIVKEGEILPDKDIYNLIFAPGFSTAEAITDISGRGVGMDVVRRNIEKLRGKIDIDTEIGSGTTFTIYLPLTLAIIEGLIVSTGEQRYILPTLSVRESFRPKAGAVSTVYERGEMVDVRGKLTPLLRLHEYFDVEPRTTDPTGAIVIVIESGAETRCLMVDDLLGKQEVVIKSLGETLGQHPALAGAAILGDGRVGLILNTDSLVRMKGPTPISSHRHAAARACAA